MEMENPKLETFRLPLTIKKFQSLIYLIIPSFVISLNVKDAVLNGMGLILTVNVQIAGSFFTQKSLVLGRFAQTDCEFYPIKKSLCLLLPNVTNDPGVRLRTFAGPV